MSGPLPLDSLALHESCTGWGLLGAACPLILQFGSSTVSIACPAMSVTPALSSQSAQSAAPCGVRGLIVAV